MSTTGRPIRMSILADDRDFSDTMRNVDRQMVGLGTSAIEADGKVSKAFKGISESADSVASKGAQVAGGLSGIGGTMDQLGISGAGIVTNIGTGLQTVADLGDVVAGSLDSAFGIAGKIKDGAAALGLFGAAEDEAAASADALAASEDGLAASEGLALGPILLVVGAIAALVAGIVLAIKYHKQIESLVKKVWGSIKKTIKGVADWVEGAVPAAFRAVKSGVISAINGVLSFVGKHWRTILSLLTGPIGAAAIQIASHWHSITGGAKDVYHDVTGWLGRMVSFVKGVPGKIGHVFSGLWSGIADSLKSALNSVLHLPLRIPTVNTHIPGIGTVGGQTLIPALAHGGITTGPTLALIGDNPGGREAVIPLDRYPNALAGGGVTVNLNGTFIGPSKADVGRWVADALNAYQRHGGRVAVA